MAQIRQQPDASTPPRRGEAGLPSWATAMPDPPHRPEPGWGAGAARGPSQAAAEALEPGDVKFAQPPAQEALGG